MSTLHDRITAALLENLRDTVGGCTCDEAYTGRGLVDPHCGWHEALGTTDAESVARVVAVLAEQTGGESAGLHDELAPNSSQTATARPGCGWCDDGRDVTHPNCDHTAQPEADAVERAARALYERAAEHYAGMTWEANVEAFRGYARAALAAAQPVEPEPDEREALARLLAAASHQRLTFRGQADAVLAAGFRRSRPEATSVDQRAAFSETVRIARDRGMPHLSGSALGLDHLLDMERRLASEGANFSDAKIGRWLGWAQAAVVAAGVTTLDEVKNLNKSSQISVTDTPTQAGGDA